jgi:Tol biopolymer transport system component
VPVTKEGKPAGEVTVIDAPKGIGEIRLLAGWTPDQKIGALMVREQEFSLYTLPSSGGFAAKILHDRIAYQPRWSTDGKRIYFVAVPDEGENRWYRMYLASVNATGGQEVLVPVQQPDGDTIRQMGNQSGNRVSPDGKWMISACVTSEDVNVYDVPFPTTRIWKLATDGTAAIPITHHEGPYCDKSPSWSPDGKKVAFVRYELLENTMHYDGDVSVHIVDADGNNLETMISLKDHFLHSLNWSPDGKKLAYITYQKVAPHLKSLNLLDVETRQIRVFEDVCKVHVNMELAWSPDSKRVAYINEEKDVVNVINIEDGNITNVETGLVDVDIYHLDWSPDGEKFVFLGIKGGDREFWFLEDFVEDIE